MIEPYIAGTAWTFFGFDAFFTALRAAVLRAGARRAALAGAFFARAVFFAPLDAERAMGLTELIALSTQAFAYFQSKAQFVEGTPADLPPERREKYDRSGRNSKVLLKHLQTSPR